MTSQALADVDRGAYTFEAPATRPEFLFISRAHEKVNMIDLATIEAWFAAAPNKTEGRRTWHFYWRPRALDGRRSCSIGSSSPACFRFFVDFKAWYDLPETQAHIKSWSDPRFLDDKPERTINAGHH